MPDDVIGWGLLCYTRFASHDSRLQLAGNRQPAQPNEPGLPDRGRSGHLWQCLRMVLTFEILALARRQDICMLAVTLPCSAFSGHAPDKSTDYRTCVSFCTAQHTRCTWLPSGEAGLHCSMHMWARLMVLTLGRQQHHSHHLQRWLQMPAVLLPLLPNHHTAVAPNHRHDPLPLHLPPYTHHPG
jgi:hypothetical protein